MIMNGFHGVKTMKMCGCNGIKTMRMNRCNGARAMRMNRCNSVRTVAMNRCNSVRSMILVITTCRWETRASEQGERKEHEDRCLNIQVAFDKHEIFEKKISAIGGEF